MADVLITFAAFALAGTFAWAGTTKILRSERWRQDLYAYRINRVIRVPGFLLLPWIEVGIAVTFIAGWVRAAAVASIMLLGVFCVVIVWARIHTGSNKIGCGCLGGTTERDYRLLLSRNASLAAIAAAILWVVGTQPGPVLVAGAPSAAPWLLAGVVSVGCGWVVWQVSRRARRVRRA